MLCKRCGEDSFLSGIGRTLFHFVCDICRLDKAGWEFNGIRIKDLEYQSPEPSAVKDEREAKNAIQKYR